MPMIKFKHDPTPTWSIAQRDCRIFKEWEKGEIDEFTASDRMAVNNDLDDVSITDFLDSARALGYRREE